MRLVRITAGLVLTAALSLAVGSVHASAASPCAPGQAYGRQPGSVSGPGTPRPPQYPAGKCQLVLSSNAVASGSSVTASGSGFQPGAPVEVSFSGTRVGTAVAASDGTFTKAFVVPANTAAGDYLVTASSGDYELAAPLKVFNAAAAPSSAGKPALRSGAGIAAPAVAASSGGAVVDAAPAVPAAEAALLPGAGAELAAPIQVTPASSKGTSGVGVLPVAGGIAFLALGGLGVLVTRRRRHTA